MEDAYRMAKDIYGLDFSESLRRKDIDEAHVAWNKIAEAASLIGQGKSLAQAAQEIQENWKRGSIPAFTHQEIQKPIDRLGNPTQHRQRELTRLRNQLADLRAKTTNAFHEWKHPIGLRSSLPQGKEEAANESAHGTQEEQEAVGHILTWSRLEERVDTVIGKEKAESIVQGEFAIPPT